MLAWYLLFVWLPASIALVGHGWWALRPRTVKVGRHRCAGRVSWRAERRMREQNERSRGNKVEFAALMRSVRRINEWLDETPAVVLDAQPAWNQPTMWEITDVGEAPKITYGRGSTHYKALATATLDDEARRLIEPVFTRSAIEFADVSDEDWELVKAR